MYKVLSIMRRGRDYQGTKNQLNPEQDGILAQVLGLGDELNLSKYTVR